MDTKGHHPRVESKHFRILILGYVCRVLLGGSAYEWTTRWCKTSPSRWTLSCELWRSARSSSRDSGPRLLCGSWLHNNNTENNNTNNNSKSSSNCGPEARLRQVPGASAHARAVNSHTAFRYTAFRYLLCWCSLLLVVV